MDGLVQAIDNNKKMLLGGDFNGLIWKDGRGYERVHIGHGCGEEMSSITGCYTLRCFWC